MPKKRAAIEEGMDQRIVHPKPDTSANTGKRGQPPPTWDPGKVTQQPQVEEQE
jgi:hypothetical protein